MDRRYLYATLAGSLFLLAFELLLPLSGDNEIYQSMAGELLRYHWLPYLGSWDQNFPGIIYIHWLSIVLFGDSALGFRVFDVIVHVGMSWMLFVLLRRWLTPSISLLAVLLYNLYYVSGGFGEAGERDVFAMFFLLLATIMLFAISDCRRGQNALPILSAFVAGAAFAMMVVIRPTYAPYLVIASVYLWMVRANSGVMIVAFVTGAACVFLAVLIPYWLVPGGIEQMYLTTIRYNLEIWGRVRIPFGALLHQLRSIKFFLLSGCAGIAMMAFRARFARARFADVKLRDHFSQIRPLNVPDLMLVAGYGLGGVVSIVSMGKFWRYHFEPVILVLIPFGALAIATGFRALPSAHAWPRRSYRLVAVLIFAGYLTLRVFPLYIVKPFVHAFAAGLPHPFDSAQVVLGRPQFLVPWDAVVADYIDRTAPRGARFECVSKQAGIRWRTPRMSASRFTTFYPLITSTPTGQHPPFQQQWRREYIDSLLSARPYYIVISGVPAEDFDPFSIPSPSRCIHDIPGFDEEVLPKYQFDTAIGGYTILKIMR